MPSAKAALKGATTMTASDGLRAEDDFDRVEESIELGRLSEDVGRDSDWAGLAWTHLIA